MNASADYKRQHLIKMANQIADNVPTREDVPAQVSQHMRCLLYTSDAADE